MKTKIPFFLFPFSFFIFHFSFFIFLSSCSSPPETNDDTVTFSGTVTLEDTTDFSGVTVALYEPVELDTAIVRINEEYPNIGVRISQETEFDHREHTPLYTTTTKADGSWKIEGVKKGTYNIVAQKEGWGWEYYLKSTNNNVSFKMLKEIKLPVQITDTYSLSNNRFYKLTNNVIIENNGMLVFGENNTILIDGAYQIILNGNIVSGKNTLITNGKNDKFKGIKLQNKENKFIFENIIIKNLNNFIDCNNVSASFKNLYLNNVGNAIKTNQADNIFISSSLFSNINSTIDIVESHFIIERNIFINNEGMININSCTGKINNNLFSSNKKSLNIILTDSITISNCIFENCKDGLSFLSSSSRLTTTNFINNNRDILIGRYTYLDSRALPQIDSCNFYLGEREWYIYFVNSNSGGKLIMNNLYWGIFDIYQIKKQIYDKAFHEGTTEVVIDTIRYKQFSNTGII